MKNALILKSADLVGQILMLVLPIVLAFGVNHNMFFGVYFAVGGWQMLSCLITRIVEGRSANSARSYWERVAAWVVGIFIVCYSVGGGLQLLGKYFGLEVLEGLSFIFIWAYILEAIAMLVVGPIMAIAYGYITYREIRHLRSTIKLRHELQW